MKCEVKLADKGGTYIAASGRGRLRRTASCTHSATLAVQRCAAKVFRIDASNTQSADDITVADLGGGRYEARLPARDIL